MALALFNSTCNCCLTFECLALITILSMPSKKNPYILYGVTEYVARQYSWAYFQTLSTTISRNLLCVDN